MVDERPNHEPVTEPETTQEPGVWNGPGNLSNPKGQTFIHIDNAPIDISEWMSKVSDPKCGAISLFAGTTREDSLPLSLEGCHSCTELRQSHSHVNRDKAKAKVVALDYSGYVPMAYKVIQGLVDTLRMSHPSVMHIAVVHRLGIVSVSEYSLLIAMSSPHRTQCQSASSQFLESFKAQVPIYKREIYDDSTRVWKENPESSLVSPLV